MLTAAALVTYSVLELSARFVAKVMPPAVTTMRESVQFETMPRQVVALDVALRSAPHAALVPVPYRFSVAGRRLAEP